MNPDINPEYNHKKTWFNQEKDFNQARRLSYPFDFLVVGSHPTDGMTKKQATSIDTFVNVSSNATYMFNSEKPRADQEFFWNPTTEFSYWGYIPLFWAKKILDKTYEEHKEVYLHCSAGVGRSPLIAMTWLISYGYTLEEINEIMEGETRNPAIPHAFENKFYLYYKRGILPPFNNLKEFYKRMNENPDTWELDSILRKDPALIKPINRTDQENIFKELEIKRKNEY